METRYAAVGDFVPSFLADTRQDASPAKFSEWLPSPPPDPDFLRRLRTLRWERAGIAVALAGGWALVFALIPFLPSPGILVGISCWLLAPATVAAWMRTQTRRAAPHVADLVDLPATCPQFPVELQYRFHGCVYGVDEGLISFVEGWMHFQGRRTSWFLSCNDGHSRVVGRHFQVLGYAALRSDANSIPFVRDVFWKKGGKPYRIRITPMDSVDGLGTGLCRGFGEAIQKWHSSARLDSRNCIYPPVAAMPGLIERVNRRLTLLGGGSAVLSVWLTFNLWGPSPGFPPLLCLGMVVVDLAALGCAIWCAMMLRRRSVLRRELEI